METIKEIKIKKSSKNFIAFINNDKVLTIRSESRDFNKIAEKLLIKFTEFKNSFKNYRLDAKSYNKLMHTLNFRDITTITEVSIIRNEITYTIE